jgi:hypothetical protein
VKPSAQADADTGARKILTHLAWRLRSARRALARAKALPRETAQVFLANAQGAYTEAWGSLQSAKAVHGEEGADVDVHTNVLDLGGRYRLDGKVWSGTHLQQALECAKTLAWAFERGAVDNGGDGAICRAEVDRAIRHAGNAMGVADLADMIATAMAENRSKRKA